MPETPEKFYLTTPIYYVNARPHIGHAYTTIVADVLARRHRLLGHDTFFLTGTDEHGQKIARSAAAANIPPQQFADQVSAAFENLWKRMGITNDGYIRTTSAEHKRGVQKFFRTLQENGAIYLDTYTGQYCVTEEAFVDVPPGAPCPDCGRITETITEENYYFHLSQYQQQIIELIESGKLSVEPEARRNEVLSFVKSGLKDLSISRTSFTWGITVPGNEKHVIYVWLDALANYMTAIGYGSDDPTEQAKFEKYWPADLHLVGKEIIRFHCVYWPAFLLAANLPLPKAITAHGWLLFEESKMSKSRGNIVRTETILDAFGDEVYGKQFPDSTKAERDLFASDALRYFLLREIPFGQDGSFSFDALITRYNADLANGYGNLVSRTLAMIEKYRSNAHAEPASLKLADLWDASILSGDIAYLLGARSLLAGIGDTERSRLLIQESIRVPEAPPIASQALAAFERHDFAQTLENISTFISGIDRFITSSTPWTLAKMEDRHEQLSAVLYVAAESIRIITALIYPVIPHTAAKVWTQLGLGDIELAAKNGELKDLQWGDLKPGTKLGELSPIFPRADKGLAQIMTDMEQNTAPKTEQPAAAQPTGQAIPAAETPAPAAINSQITIDDFAKLDLRAAKILVVERVPKADKLLRLEVDLGPSFNPARRQILSGIAEWYAPEDLVGRMVVVIANLAPRTMRGLESHGMLLAASEGENGKPILATFGENIAPGSRLK